MGMFSGMVRRAISDQKKIEDMMFPYSRDEIFENFTDYNDTTTMYKKIRWFFQDNDRKKLAFSPEMCESFKFFSRIETKYNSRVPSIDDENLTLYGIYINDTNIVYIYIDKELGGSRYRIVK